eukprot:6673214-Pyramimonas_sp.AAC.1
MGAVACAAVGAVHHDHGLRPVRAWPAEQGPDQTVRAPHGGAPPSPDCDAWGRQMLPRARGPRHSART